MRNSDQDWFDEIVFRFLKIVFTKNSQNAYILWIFIFLPQSGADFSKLHENIIPFCWQENEVEEVIAKK